MAVATFGFLQIPPRGQAAGPEEAGLSVQGDPPQAGA